MYDFVIVGDHSSKTTPKAKKWIANYLKWRQLRSRIIPDQDHSIDSDSSSSSLDDDQSSTSNPLPSLSNQNDVIMELPSFQSLVLCVPDFPPKQNLEKKYRYRLKKNDPEKYLELFYATAKASHLASIIFAILLKLCCRYGQV